MLYACKSYYPLEHLSPLIEESKEVAMEREAPNLYDKTQGRRGLKRRLRQGCKQCPASKVKVSKTRHRQGS